MRLYRWCLGAAVIAAPLAAKGQPLEGFYIGAGAGYDLQQSIRVTPTVPGVGTLPLQTGQSDGFRVLGSVGYGLGNGLRLEVEGDFLRTSLRASNITILPGNIGGIAVPGTTLNGLVPNNLSGHLLSYGALANALYDFNVGIPYAVPYVGAGAGVIWNDLTHSGSFAYQAIGGLSFPIAAAPGLSLTAEYRFLDVTAGEQYNATVAVPGGNVPVHVKIGAQLNHSFLIGVRYAFNSPVPPSPAPAPSPVAASVPARSYLVFFDWDKASLTDRARQIIEEAAKNSQHIQYTQIEVNGYTDTSGKPAYNTQLSIRRAQNVAGELVRDGVPRAAISIHGFGDTHLLVPTGQDVREPQNRRVEIIIR